MGLGLLILSVFLLPIIFGLIVTFVGCIVLVKQIVCKGKISKGFIVIFGGLGIIIADLIIIGTIVVPAKISKEVEFNSIENKLVIEEDKDYGDSFKLDDEKYVEVSFLRLDMSDNYIELDDTKYTLVWNKSNVSELKEIDYVLEVYEIPFDLYYSNLGHTIFCRKQDIDELREYYQEYEPRLYNYNDEPVWELINIEKGE